MAFSSARTIASILRLAIKASTGSAKSDGKGAPSSIPKSTSEVESRLPASRGTVWQHDPDGKNLELIAHNFRNNLRTVRVDSFGTVFLSDNDDDGIQLTTHSAVMPGGNYGYHRTPKTSHWNEEHPGIVPKILPRISMPALRPRASASGEGNLFPKPYQGQLFHVDAGPRQARCYHLTVDGASKVNQENMADSSDNRFRPVGYLHRSGRLREHRTTGNSTIPASAATAWATRRAAASFAWPRAATSRACRSSTPI